MKLRRMMKNTWCWKFINTKPGKYIKFFIMLILDLIDLGIDWFFYAQVQLIQPGLVYGPPPASISWCIFAFCIVSVICLCLETIQNADDLFFGHRIKWLTQSLTNFMVIFLEDIPLLVINLIVTICRDGDPTVITVVKASVGIAIVILRTTLMLLIYWLFETKKNRFTFILDAMSSLGLFIIAGISIAIQLLNTFPTDSRGLIQTADPVVFNRMTYVTDKYLNGVGIYSAWPLDSTANSTDYIWLADISEVVADSVLDVRIYTDYELSPHNYSLCLTRYSLTTCYSVVNGSMSKVIDDPSFVASIGNSGYEISIAKEPAQTFKYKIGYLDYNLNRFGDSPTGRTCRQSTATSLIYAKYANLANTNSTKSEYLKASQFGYSFYSLEFDLLTVDRVWRTGVFRCHMSGDLGPKLNRNIRVVC